MSGVVNKYALGLLLLFTAMSANAGSFLINEISGFDDTTPVSPVGGNTGTTIGEQRSIVFAQAATIWASIVQPAADVTIDVEFTALTPCEPDLGPVGSAGPQYIDRDWTTPTPVPLPGTWYPMALAQHLRNVDYGVSAIGSSFNSNIGTSGCLTGLTWYYGLDGNAGVNQADLLTIVLHELAHGIGFVSLVDNATGAKAGGFDDVFMTFLRDDSLDKSWPAMTDGERVASAIDSDDLVWTGPQVQHLLSILSGTETSTTNGYPQMYAPGVLEVGSSVAHWDVDITYDSGANELMEYLLATPWDMAMTVALMRDIGWGGAYYDYDLDGTSDENDAVPESNVADTDTDDDGLVDDWLPGSGCSGPSCNGYGLDGDDDGDGVQDVVDADPLDDANTAETSLPLNAGFTGANVNDNAGEQ